MDTQQGPTFDQDLSTIVSQLPAPIKAFFVSGKVEIIAKNLMQKYQLHIDQGAIVEREIILLLLGLKNPEEFTKTLAEEANLNKQTIDSIMQDINAQIFIPLREEEMKSGGMKIEQPAKPAPPSQPEKYFHLENKIPPRSVAPEVPKPPADEKLLEDHEEPHIDISDSPRWSSGEAGKVQVASLPGTQPPISIPLKPSTLPLTPKINPIPPVPPKPYSIDPYHEPIDEK